MLLIIKPLTPHEKFTRNTAYLLKQKRLKLRLLKKEAEQLAGLHDKQLCRIENGMHLADLATYHKLAEAYKVDKGFITATYSSTPTAAMWREIHLLDAQLIAHKRSKGRIKMQLGVQLELGL